MPVPAIEKLTPGSSKAQINAAISECIAAEVRAGRPQEQAVAMCRAMAQEKTSSKSNSPAPSAPPEGLEGIEGMV